MNNMGKDASWTFFSGPYALKPYKLKVERDIVVLSLKVSHDLAAFYFLNVFVTILLHKPQCIAYNFTNVSAGHCSSLAYPRITPSLSPLRTPVLTVPSLLPIHPRHYHLNFYNFLLTGLWFSVLASSLDY